jgi:hypothetical protein
MALTEDGKDTVETVDNIEDMDKSRKFIMGMKS